MALSREPTVYDVANKFIELGEGRYSHLTLQKLVYFALGWYAAFTGKKLFNEDIQAWHYGPVSPTLYNALKGFGSTPINRQIPSLSKDSLGPEQIELINEVNKTYGGLSASKLVTLSHDKNGPWEKLYSPENSKANIPWNIIKDHFESLNK